MTDQQFTDLDTMVAQTSVRSRRELIANALLYLRLTMRQKQQHGRVPAAVDSIENPKTILVACLPLLDEL